MSLRRRCHPGHEASQVPGTWQVPGTFISNHEWANFVTFVVQNSLVEKT
jgi:hypothetical protein